MRLRCVVIQDQAGGVSARDLDCSLRGSSVEREGQMLDAIPLTGPLCR
jgi:hypothetical protein